VALIYSLALEFELKSTEQVFHLLSFWVGHFVFMRKHRLDWLVSNLQFLS